MPRNNRGFTLIELLVALALLTVLAGALYGTYFSVTAARERGGARIEARRELATTLGKLHSELASAFFKGTTNKRLLFVVEDRDSFGKPASTLAFTWLTPPRIDPAPGSDLQLVAYAIKEHDGVLTLTRESRDPYMDKDRVRSYPYPVMDEVEGFLVECYNGSNWVKTWDTALNNGLPKSIRVTVTTKGGQQFSTVATPRLSPP